MRLLTIICYQLSFLMLYATSGQGQGNPIMLHPGNGHYFSYNGRTTVLITSAEHYGAVLNAEFDYEKYLNTLADDGMNYTRIFAGSYFEIYGESFGIENNTLAPRGEYILVPWKSSVVNDRRVYDISEWNEPYFSRLRDFIRKAGEKEIIVEVTLFSSIYNDDHWEINPQNPENWKAGNFTLERRAVHTLNNGKVLEMQRRYVERVVRELNEFNNIFFEIQNEPWSDRTVPVLNIANKEELKENDWTNKADFADSESMKWQESMAELIQTTESELAKQHLIAQNYTNFMAPVPVVSDRISIINFHYAWPQAALLNYHYDKVIGFDESGFAGSGDDVYRRQAWRFMLSGGGLFNNLDYSFTVGHEDGKAENKAPGGGSSTLRTQLAILKDFLDSFTLEDMHPDPAVIAAAPGMMTYAMTDENKSSVAIYLQAVGIEDGTLSLALPDGSYEVLIVEPESGDRWKSGPVKTEHGKLVLPVSFQDGELAIKLMLE